MIPRARYEASAEIRPVILRSVNARTETWGLGPDDHVGIKPLAIDVNAVLVGVIVFDIGPRLARHVIAWVKIPGVKRGFAFEDHHEISGIVPFHTVVYTDDHVFRIGVRVLVRHVAEFHSFRHGYWLSDAHLVYPLH